MILHESYYLIQNFIIHAYQELKYKDQKLQVPFAYKHSNSYNWNLAPINQGKKHFPFIQLSGLLKPLQRFADIISTTWIHIPEIRGIL